MMNNIFKMIAIFFILANTTAFAQKPGKQVTKAAPNDQFTKGNKGQVTSSASKPGKQISKAAPNDQFTKGNKGHVTSSVKNKSISNNQPVIFNCKDFKSGIEAKLEVISQKEIIWNEEFHSARSRGAFSSIISIEHNPRFGDSEFVLTDFAMSEDSAFMLSVPQQAFYKSSKKSKSVVFAVTLYFDNDDHEEDHQEFICQK